MGVGDIGASLENRESDQEARNRSALELIENSKFLKPLLYRQFKELYDENPESEGYVRGRYVGKGNNRTFEKGEGEGYDDFLENTSITDIGFDGYNLYVVDNEIGHYQVNDPEKDPRIKAGLPKIECTAKDVEVLARNVANQMKAEYNTANPIFDIELGYLRTNFVAESVAPYGNTMALRVSRPSLAIKNLSDMATEEVTGLIEVLMRTKTNILISGSTGSGKSVADSQLVPTPEGLVRHGDLKVGDVVYDRLGNETKVLEVYPQGELEVYELELKDGRKVRVSGDHHWVTWRTNQSHKVLDKEEDSYYKKLEIEGLKGWKVRTTEDLKEEISKGNKYRLPKGEDKKGKEEFKQEEIVNIKKLGYKENMQCILVDNEEHLYQLEQGVVTKNTEYQKKMVGFIPNEQKITLMEDTMDSHIKEIYPEKDINSWVTNIVTGTNEMGRMNVDFQELLRAALRNFPDWAIVSEVRGAEAAALLSVALSGHAVVTTLHTRGAASIPERMADMVSMGDSKMDYGALLRNILSVFKIGIHLERGTDPVNGKTIRYVREIYEYVDYDDELGIIGYPLYKRSQVYNQNTGEYQVKKQHYRMSDELIQTITNLREIDKLPDVFKKGVYQHETLESKRNRSRGL